MAEAGADFFLRSDLRTSTALVDVVAHGPARPQRPANTDAAIAHALGITSRSHVSGLVSYVARHNLAPALSPVAPDRSDRHSRRWYHHRQAMAYASRTEPVNVTTGVAPRPAGTNRKPSQSPTHRFKTYL